MEKKELSEDRKIEMLMEGFKERRSGADVAREYGVSPSMYYRWRKRFLEAGRKALVEGVPGKSGFAWKRKHERVDARVPARIELVGTKQKKRILNLLTGNICAGGAYFYTPQPLSEKTKVKLDIVFPLKKLNKSAGTDNVLVKVQGTVLRSNHNGMAILFQEDYKVYRLKK